MQSPPDWISAWYTLLIVQVAGVIAAGIAIWKWLTKPLRVEQKRTVRRLVSLKKIFKQDSFDLRTAATSIQKIAVENERRIDRMEHQLEDIQDSVERMEASLNTGFREIRDRLTSLETEVRIRVEQQGRKSGGETR